MWNAIKDFRDMGKALSEMDKLALNAFNNLDRNTNMRSYNIAEVQNIIRLSYESAFACKPHEKVQKQLNSISKEAYEPLYSFFMSIKPEEESLPKEELVIDQSIVDERDNLKKMLDKTKESNVKLQEIIDKLNSDNQEISDNWQNVLEGNNNLKEYADKKEAQVDMLLDILQQVVK